MAGKIHRDANSDFDESALDETYRLAGLAR